MTDRPILFQGAMATATLAGTKTQTRRQIGRLSGFGKITEFGRSQTAGYDWTFRDRRALWNDLGHERMIKACPYGRPGDRLWGKETGQIAEGGDAWMYPDRGGRLAPTAKPGTEHHCRLWKSCPSIHMPRWASRILLELTEVRIERVQSITEADARAEGAELVDVETLGKVDPTKRSYGASYRLGFIQVWAGINGPESWASNPYVWALTFKRIEQPR